MSVISNIVYQIRHAIYGRDVRENIAKGIEECYDDVSTSTTLADNAATRANTAAARSETINEALGNNAADLVIVNQTQPALTKEFNKIWIKPESDEYVVPTMAEHNELKSALSKAVFADDFEFTKTNSSVIVSWSRLYFVDGKTAYDFNTQASYSLSSAQPVLVVRNGSLMLLSQYSSILKSDAVLLNYRYGELSGILYPYLSEKLTLSKVADVFSESKSYNKDEYALYNKKIYRFVTDHSGQWSNPDVTEVRLANEIYNNNEELLDKISETTSEILDADEIEFSDFDDKLYIATNGEYADIANPSIGSKKMKYAVVRCVEGDTFTIYGSGGNASRLWAFTNANEQNKIINVAAANTSANGLVLQTPENATHLIINSEIDAPCFYGETEIVKYRHTLKTLFCTGFNATFENTRVTLSWSRLYIVDGSGSYDFNGNASYILTNSNPILAFGNGTLRTISSFNAIGQNDIVLASYRNGDVVGPLAQYIKTQNFKVLFCTDFNASFEGTTVTLSWSRLYVVDGLGSYDFNETASYVIGNTRTLVVRNGELTIVDQLSNIRKTDIVLAYYRDGMVVGPLAQYIERGARMNFYNDAEHNVYKQVRQLANLKWTPLITVTEGAGTRPAGVEVTGAPYSSVKEYLKYIAIDVSIHTFMTAIHDPHSLVYTECPIGRPDAQRSAYGRTYHGINCFMWYGSVCSGLVTTAIGNLIHYNSWEYRAFPDVYEVLENQHPKNLKVGDVLSENGHCAVLAKIDRDENGEITSWEIDEHSAPIALRSGLDENSMILRGRNGVWCRPKKLFNNLHYKPNVFVLLPGEYLYNPGDVVFIDDDSSRTFYVCTTLNSDSEFTQSKWDSVELFSGNTSYSINDIVQYGEEAYRCKSSHTSAAYFESDLAYWEKLKGITEWTPYPYAYNDDIVTFAGDQAAFHTNDLIYINYNKGEYTQMQIFKDGTLLQTLTLPSNAYQIDVSQYCTSYGKYKARLTNGTVYSRHTYFEVVDTNVSATMSNGIAEINFSSANGEPIEAQIVGLSGMTYGHVEFNEQELTDGKIYIDPQARLYSERRGCWGYYNLEGNTIELYARVMFKGEYGNVVNEMILLGNIVASSGEIIISETPTDLGIISEATKIFLNDRLSGKRYSFSFTEGDGGSVTIQPASGMIKWANTLPNELSVGTTYLVSVENGIGNVTAVS